MIQAFSTWLHGTTLSWAVAGGVPWIWPLCETLHFMGLALLVGIVGVFDLRILGMAKGLPVGPIQRLMPWAILGFRPDKGSSASLRRPRAFISKRIWVVSRRRWLSVGASKVDHRDPR